MRQALRGSARVITLVVTLLAITAATAFAHVTLQSTSPGAGSVQKSSPKTASATFSGEIKSGTIKVYDASNTKVSKGNGAKDPRNVKRVSTSLNADLPNGRYTAKWNITAPDGHKQSGSFSFRIKK